MLLVLSFKSYLMITYVFVHSEKRLLIFYAKVGSPSLDYIEIFLLTEV